MAAIDWIVVGGGITGSALAYELVERGLSVLLLERHADLQGGSRFGYGGVSYWACTTTVTRQLATDARSRYPTLSQELDWDVQYRELDLVLTIPAELDPELVAASYSPFTPPPTLVDVKTACHLEPLLNPIALSGALTVNQGHVHLSQLVAGLRQAFVQRGGSVQVAEVTGLLRDRTQIDRITGVVCGSETLIANNVVICAGGLGRALLNAAGIHVPLYFTHAELIETPPVDIILRSLVMPAVTQRFELEATASSPNLDRLWDEPGHEPTPAILDAGAIQFLDGSLRIGQMSRTLTDPNAAIDAALSEQAIRKEVGVVLPALQSLPGTWHRCLVSFSRDRLPLVGAIPNLTGLHLFSGFSNPLVFTLPLAQRFANSAIDQPDNLLPHLALTRFSASGSK